MTKNFNKTPSGLLKTAMNIFLEYGFDNTSMEQIAKQANVSKTTLYKNIGNKEECFKKAISSYRLVQKINPPVMPTTYDHNMLQHKKYLQKFILDFVNYFNNPGVKKLMKVIIMETPKFPNLYESFYMEQNLNITEVLSHYLINYYKTQATKEEERYTFLAIQIVGMIRESTLFPHLVNFQWKIIRNEKPEMITYLIANIFKLLDLND